MQWDLQTLRQHFMIFLSFMLRKETQFAGTANKLCGYKAVVGCWLLVISLLACFAPFCGQRTVVG